jgi:modulator of FtsH protease
MDSSAGWTDFLVAAAGATGALAGLLFVALSINLTRILALTGLPGRAAETVLLLASGLIGSLLALMPGLSSSELGLLMMGLWLPTWGLPTLYQIQALHRRQFHRLNYALLRFGLYQAATVPLLLTGLSLRGYLTGGLHWFAVALLLSLSVALFNAWVLLVEILR